MGFQHWRQQSVLVLLICLVRSRCVIIHQGHIRTDMCLQDSVLTSESFTKGFSRVSCTLVASIQLLSTWYFHW